MERLRGLDDLKSVCLLLLFLVHSDLVHSNYELVFRLQGLLLGGFFLVSGYLTYLSLSHRSIRQFIANKALKLYVPYVLVVLLYYWTEQYTNNPLFNHWPSDAPIIHVLGLNVLDRYKAGNYNPYHLWYIPVLITYMALFALFNKIRNRWQKFSMAILIYVLVCLTWPNGLNMELEWYYLPFMIGYFMAEWKLIEHLNVWWIPLLALAAFRMTQPLLHSNWEALNHLFTFTGEGFYSVSVALLVLAIFKWIKPPLLGRLAKYSLATYLLEPFVSYLLSSQLLGEPFPNYVSGEIYPIFTVLRIASTLLLAWTICLLTMKLHCRTRSLFTSKSIIIA